MNDVFDLPSSLARLGGDHQLFETLVQFYREDSPGLLEQIRRGFARNDAKLVERGGHSLKGLVASFSADGARDAADRVAERARQGDLPSARESFSELEIEVRRLDGALASYLERAGSNVRA